MCGVIHDKEILFLKKRLDGFNTTKYIVIDLKWYIEQPPWLMDGLRYHESLKFRTSPCGVFPFSQAKCLKSIQTSC